MNKVSIIGSTGSIGIQALAVLHNHLDYFQVVSLAAGSGVALFEKQVLAFRPTLAVLAYPPLGYRPPRIPGVEWCLEDTPEKAVSNCDTVLNAIVGARGLTVSLAAARAGVRLCLANKETLVAGGRMFIEEQRMGGGELLPVDSEHSAIHQCLEGRKTPPERLLLTASGGPFRTWPLTKMGGVTPAQALKHPNWAMGRRISVDSATMVNKALEVIEAGYLFDMPSERIDVLIHPSSIIHSMVQYLDGTVLAQLGVPDMRLPIAYALGYPKRLETSVPKLDLFSCGPLKFERPDIVRFPALRMGYDVLGAEGISGAVFNAADEVAVQGFFNEKCGFLDIVRLCGDALAAVPQITHPTLPQIMEADARARQYVEERLEKEK